MILVRDRSTEQRHDAVAGELVDEAFHRTGSASQIVSCAVTTTTDSNVRTSSHWGETDILAGNRTDADADAACVDPGLPAHPEPSLGDRSTTIANTSLRGGSVNSAV
jgi:hypothetical protein